MSLQPGQILAHYRLVEKIGEGGMGVVWKAEDTKLSRPVAVKVLPSEFAEDMQRLGRFEREAKLLAALNHPNVAAIYGLEAVAGVHFLVLELVDGRTLAEMTRTGPLPVEEALDVCRQVAEGLEAAHEAGVIHRDLKPGNVIVTEDGKAKVLDFGLAKGVEGAPGGESGPDLSMSPTIGVGGTQAGVVLGTAPYMSPEQARGKKLDKRTDIWSFGCLLYECLTGNLAFAGETVTDTLSAILQNDPDWEALPGKTPGRVRELLGRCLTKSPRNRVHHIADARIEIEQALATREWTRSGAVAATSGISAAGAGRAGSRISLAWGVTGLLVGLTAAALVFRGSPAPPPASTPEITRRSFIELPESAPLALATASPLGVAGHSLALSPDGSHLVYAADVGGKRRIYSRSLDQLEATPIPGTEGGYSPFFSPDGSQVAFFTRDKLKRVSLQGGEPVILCESRVTAGGSWGDDGMIYFTHSEGQLARIPVMGGEPDDIRPADKRTNLWAKYPQALPAGSGLLLTSSSLDSGTAEYATILHLSPETGSVKKLIEGGYHARYVPTGHLVFMRGGGLFAAPFHLETLEVTGAAFSLVDGIWTDSTWGVAQFSISQEGSLVYAAGGDWARTIPTWLDRQGEEEPLSVPAQVYGAFKLSPGGERLAIQVMGPKDQIHVYDSVRGSFSRATLLGSNARPVWTADGTRLIFSSKRDDSSSFQLYWQAVDAGSAPEMLTSETGKPGPGSYNVTSVSPDGRLLAMTHFHPARLGDLWLLPLQGDREAQPFLSTEYMEWGAAFSPDGRWIAFTSDKTARYEVFVRPYPENDREWQVSDGGGEEPIWSPRGDELFYRNGKKLMVVPVSSDTEFRAGQPRVLLEARFHNSPGPSFDVAPDAQRFVVNKPTTSEETVTKLHLVTGWFQELRHTGSGAN